MVSNSSWLFGGFELMPMVVLFYSRIATISFVDAQRTVIGERYELLGRYIDTLLAHGRKPSLGMLLKIDMMRWLAHEQPQLESLETWNNVDNRYMINVNEAIGYRLSRVFNAYELKLEEAAGYGANQKVVQPAVS